MADCTAEQAAVTAAQQELTIRELAASISATPANIAAVTALQARVASAEKALSECNSQPVPPPTPPIDIGNNPSGSSGSTGSTGSTGGTGPAPPSPPTTGTGSTGGTSGTGGTGAGPVGPLGPLTASEVGLALTGYLTDDDVTIEQFIDMTGTETTATDAWSYLQDQVEDVFTDLEGAFDTVADTGFGVETGVSIAEIAAGTTASIADLPAVALVAALIAGEYVTGWLLQQVGKYFPDPSIFGWHPLNFISEGITAVGNQFAGGAENLASDIVNVIQQPIRQLVGLFQRGINAVAGAHDKTARIVQDTVPTAQQAAITAAQQYTDEQTDIITNAATQALTILDPPPTVAQAKQIIADYERYGGLTFEFEAIAASAIVSAGQYTDDATAETQQQIAAAEAQAESDAQTAITNLQTELINRLSGDESTLAALSTAVNTTLPADINAATANAESVDQQRLTAATNTIEQQIAAIQAQIATLQQQVAAANATIATAQANIVNLQSQATVDEAAIAQEQATITAAQTSIATNTTAISTLYTQMTGISDTLGPIQNQVALNTQQLAPFEGLTDVALPVALAALSTTLNNLKTDVDECMVDNCNTANPNNIRNVLLGLLALLTDAAEIGFIAEAIKDPTGTANALAPILDSLDSGAVDTLNALLSL